jgi:hypothetical protein
VRRGPGIPSAAQAPSLTAAVQPLLEKVAGGQFVEDAEVTRAWEMYSTPEVRFACRQYSNAFSSAKILLARHVEVGKDPEPVTEPKNAAEAKALELVRSFAGGPEGQTELLDRMGTYFMVPGDMVLVGAYDPARMAESKFAKWDLWSTSEVRWDGQKVRIQTEAIQDNYQEMPDYIRHVRVWNRHPQYGWKSDSPVLAAMTVLQLVGLYDNRLMADCLSRLIGAGVWLIPQGMSLPTNTGQPGGGTPNDFLRLMIEIGSMAMKDPRGPAATLPVLIEAAAEDIVAAKDSLVDFSTKFDEQIGDLQDRAIKRFATAVDLPSENMTGLSAATHWNASLISEDKVQSFVVPSLRRAVGNLTWGFLKPALLQFGHENTGLCMWFDPSGIKTRVELGDEAKWGNENLKVGDRDAKYLLGLDQTKTLEGDELRRQALVQMMVKDPASTPLVLKELGIAVSDELLERAKAPRAPQRGDGGAQPPAGLPGPQAANGADASPRNGGNGRTANLETAGR